VARRNNRSPASKQEGAGTHTHPPKKNPAGSWAGFFVCLFVFFLGVIYETIYLFIYFTYVGDKKIFCLFS
jgi:hypothetical protein